MWLRMYALNKFSLGLSGHIRVGRKDSPVRSGQAYGQYLASDGPAIQNLRGQQLSNVRRSQEEKKNFLGNESRSRTSYWY
jgi:hypothetical protein